jgi:hypothetical protein
VAELERTIAAMKRVVEKLQHENKRLLSGRKNAILDRKVSDQCHRSFKYTEFQKIN